MNNRAELYKINITAMYELLFIKAVKFTHLHSAVSGCILSISARQLMVFLQDQTGNSSDILTAAELTDDMDDGLLQWILWVKNHILHALRRDHRPKLDYEFRPRCHDCELAPKLSCLTESNFLIKQLYKNCY